MGRRIEYIGDLMVIGNSIEEKVRRYEPSWFWIEGKMAISSSAAVPISFVALHLFFLQPSVPVPDHLKCQKVPIKSDTGYKYGAQGKITIRAHI